MIEELFTKSRFLVLVAVVVCGISAVLLYFSSILVTYNLIAEFLFDIPTSGDAAKNLVVKLLKTLDTLLIGVTFQIIAVSLYQIFISPIPETKTNFLPT